MKYTFEILGIVLGNISLTSGFFILLAKNGDPTPVFVKFLLYAPLLLVFSYLIFSQDTSKIRNAILVTLGSIVISYVASVIVFLGVMFFYS